MAPPDRESVRNWCPDRVLELGDSSSGGGSEQRLHLGENYGLDFDEKIAKILTLLAAVFLIR